VVELDGTGEVNNWPVLTAAEVGHWLPARRAGPSLRDYLLRGGFFMVDDFHGTQLSGGVREWDTFVDSMTRVFSTALSKTFPTTTRFPPLRSAGALQVPGAQFLETGITYAGGRDRQPALALHPGKQGRIMVAICHNMDLGDGVGALRQPAVSREIRVARLSHRDELFHLRFDALRSCA
jgi:hypothetical protein